MFLHLNCIQEWYHAQLDQSYLSVIPVVASSSVRRQVVRRGWRAASRIVVRPVVDVLLFLCAGRLAVVVVVTAVVLHHRAQGSTP